MTGGLSPEAWAAVALSVRVSLVAILCSLPFALFVAYALARWQFPGKQIVNGIVHLPLILPPVVTGYLLLIAFGRKGPVGAFLEQVFGLTFAFRWTGAALAAGIMAFPLVVRAIRLGIEAVDPRLIEAAGTLGASRIAVFRTVVFPLILPAVLAGAVLGWAKALGEFGATITFVSSIPGQTQTMPLAIYGLLQRPGGEAEALRLVIVSIALSFAALLFSEWLGQRVAARIGRRG